MNKDLRNYYHSLGVLLDDLVTRTFGQRISSLVHTQLLSDIDLIEATTLQNVVADDLIQSNDFEPDKLDCHEGRDHGKTESKMPVPRIPDPEQDTTDNEGNIHGWDNLDDVLRFEVGNQDKLGTNGQNRLLKGVE